MYTVFSQVKLQVRYFFLIIQHGTEIAKLVQLVLTQTSKGLIKQICSTISSTHLTFSRIGHLTQNTSQAFGGNVIVATDSLP